MLRWPFIMDDVSGASYDEERRARERRRIGVFGDSGSGRQGDGLVWLLGIASVITLVVIAKLLWLQVFTASSLAADAQTQRTNIITLHSKRGTIYDRNGNVLAVSEECQTIYANPQEVNDPSGSAKLMATYLGGTSEDYIDKLRGDDTFVYIERQVDEDVAQQLQAALTESGARGIYFLDDVRRMYPYGSVAGQVLGSVGIDGDGLSGLELYYDDILHGVDGEMIVEMGQGGTPIAGAAAQISEAQDGTDIIISIDVNIQQVAEEQIAEAQKTYEAESGSVLVTNPQTGEILAICSTPLLDLTKTDEVDSEAFTLKSVSLSYEPGSIFKILTASIGIEDGLMTPESSWYVPAELQVGDDLINDVDDRDYSMTMTLREMMRRSSNTGIALIAQDVIGAKRFSEGIASFQIGELSGIDYPGEVVGIVKTLDEYDGSTLGTMSYGQGLAIPMTQIVKAVGSVANGGTLYSPHFLIAKGGEEVSWPATGTTVTELTASEVTDMLRTVAEEGTAEGAGVEGYDVAAKTGTAQQVKDDGSGYETDRYVSSLIGYANADDPDVLVYVGLNGTPYFGATAASSAFKAIMGEALSDMGVKPSVQEGTSIDSEA